MKTQDVIRVVACACSLTWTAASFAQSTYGSISGTVVDASGGVISRATVEATKQGSGVTRSTSTDSAGNYVFVSLDPGTYSITVSAAGFTSKKNDSITLLAREIVRSDFQLDVAGTRENVEVLEGQTVVSAASAVRNCAAADGALAATVSGPDRWAASIRVPFGRCLGCAPPGLEESKLRSHG